MNPSASSALLEAIYYLDIENLLDDWLSETDHVASLYETVRIDKTVRDIFAYLDQLTFCIDDILKHQTDPVFFYKTRREVCKMMEIIRKINVFLREAFAVTDPSLNKNVVALLQKATLQAMDTMKKATSMGKNSEKANSLIELRELIILELGKEISDCKLQFSLLKKIPSPVTLLDKLPIESLLEYVSSASLLSTQELFGSTSKLLVFTEIERSFYTAITVLESRLDPMQISVEMLKYKVSDLEGLQGGFDVECKKVKKNAVKLEESWTALLTDFILLKNKTIGARIVSVCRYLNTQVLVMIDQAFKEASLGEIDMEKIGPSFKTCSAAINLIRRISTSGVPGIQACVLQYTEEISPKWNRLNELLQGKQQPVSEYNQTFKPSFINPKKDNNNILLRTLKTRKSLTPLAEVTHERVPYSTNRNSLGLGINLNIGVEPSPSVPFSISKTDRIIDLGVDSSYLLKNNIELALLQHAEGGSTEHHIGRSMDHVDEKLSLPNTPAMFSLSSPTQMNESRTTETTPFYRNDKDDQARNSQEKLIPVLTQEEKRHLLRSLRTHDTTPSRIPTMVAGYSSLNLPVLRKEYRSSHGPSRIPTISSDNEVFCSPERRSNIQAPAPEIPSSQFLKEPPSLKANSTVFEGLRSPPAFLIAHETSANRQRRSSKKSPGALGDVTNVHTRSLSLNAPAGKLSLSGLETPNLAFSQGNDAEPLRSMNWRSTSPERPGSPMGSRYDDKNLTPSLKYAKKPWK